MNNMIKKIIKEKKLRTTCVIKKTGISKSAFYDIRNGKSIPSLVTARKICKVLGKTVDEVFPI